MRAKGKNRKSRKIHLAKMGSTTSETINKFHARTQSGKRLAKMLGDTPLGCFFSIIFRVVLRVVLSVLVLALFDGVANLVGCDTDNPSPTRSVAELDRIRSYCVDVVPQPDGTLEITYNIEWQVLDGTSEGPLSWVKLGLANSECELIESGGNADRVTINGTYAKIYLDRDYGTGETAYISLCVHQGRMLCRNESDPSQPFYEFTPGWFDDIRVDQYRFTWAVSDGILAHNSDGQTDDQLIWEGSFSKGGRRAMSLKYDINAFDSPELVDYAPSSGSSGTTEQAAVNAGDSCTENQIMVAVVAISIIVLILVINSYHGGRGFGGRGRYHHTYVGSRGGGGRSCACAGCACACACAGGGRAGCSVKDFYSNEEDTEFAVSSYDGSENTASKR